MHLNPQISDYSIRKFRALLNTYAGEELPMWPAFLQGVSVVDLAAGEVLYDRSLSLNYVFMVEAGLFKAQLPGPGRDATMYFAEEGDIMAPLTAFGVPSVVELSAGQLHPRASSLADITELDRSYVVSALERSRVIRADSTVLLALARSHRAWATLAFRIAIMRAMVLQADAHWQRQSPEQRYVAFLDRNPALAARVSQRELAMYLNVTDASLSRIVRRVRGLE